MKNRKLLISILCLPLLVSLTHDLHAQGIKITSGAYMKTTGAAYVVIHDGSFVNNGTFTTSTGNTVKMYGSLAGSVTASAKTTFDNLTVDNSNGVTINSDVDINNTLTLTGGNLNVGAHTLGINGTIAKTSGFLNVGTSSSLSFGGTSAITLNDNFFSTLPSINNLTIDRSGGVTLGNQNMTINGSLALTAGTLSLGARILILAGSSPTRTSGYIDASNASATLAFTNSSAITLPASIFTGNVNNLTVNGTGGITASSSFTVAGILNLQSANPSSTKGSLDIPSDTLTMGANATTIGAGDVTGYIKRTSFNPLSLYTFGNQYTTVIFQNTGTLPSSMCLNVSIGTAPTWKTDAVKRLVDVTQHGESGSYATLALHYLDGELNGNTGNQLSFWTADWIAANNDWSVMDFGRSQIDETENWVRLSGVPLILFPQEFDTTQETLANSVYPSLTWTGAEDTIWANTNNWSGGIPNAVSNVIIPDASGTPHDPRIPPNISVIGTLTIQSGGIVNTSPNDTLIITGNTGALINSGGTLNVGTGDIFFPNNSPTISGTIDFYNVAISDTTTLWLMDGSHVRIAGNVTRNNGAFKNITGGISTIEYNGGNQDVVGPESGVNNFYHLILSGSGTKTLPASELYIFGDFTMAGSAAATLTDSLTVAGFTTLNGTSILTLGDTNILSNSIDMVLNGGTLKTGATTGYPDTTGTLNLSDNSTIALGTGSHSLIFAASNGINWTSGKMLTITGWTGSWDGTTGTAGKIFVGNSSSGLTDEQLRQIRFYNGSIYYAAIMLSTGEVVPTANFITTGTIAGSPFCAGSYGISVPFTYSLTTNFSGATFTAQLSDASGLFTSPVTLQNVACDGSGSQSIDITIPSGTITGTSYRVRVVSDSPATTGAYYGDLTVNALPSAGLTVGGSGSVCSGTGTNITVALSESGIDYQLRNDDGNVNIGSPISGTGGTINLPTGDLTSTTTFNVLATNATTGCLAELSSTPTVIVDPLPAVGLTVGGTGTICSGSGTNVTVALSESGINYQLRNDDGDINVGSPVPGTGGTIDLPTGNLTSATTFNVMATNATTSCSAELTGKATIAVNPSDITLAVGGSGEICACEGESVDITVASSVIGTSYQLRDDSNNNPIGDPVAGTGETINLPTGVLTTTTSFNVYATQGSCSAELTNTATVTVNELPAMDLTVDGSGDICYGGSTAITVASSEIGTKYQLRNDDGDVNIGSPVEGIGGTINLPTGDLTASTTFNVWATIISTNCSAELTETEIITVNPYPAVGLNVSGDLLICYGTGTDISVAYSEIGVSYQLRNDDGDIDIGSPVAGTGGTIYIPTGDLVSPTTFNILATNATTSCSAELTEKFFINTSPLPDNSLIVGGTGSICSGDSTNITVELSAFYVNYQLRNDDGDVPIGLLVAGNGGTINLPTGPLTSTTTYNVLATKSTTGCEDELTNKATVTVNQRKKISGTFTYYNTSNTLLTGADIVVELYKTSDVGHSTLLGKDTTNVSGYYEFTYLCPDCDYDIVATSAHTTEGAINTTDAAQVNYYGAYPYLIEKVRFHAGDVGTSGTLSDLTIQATDAGRIQQHFVYGTAFDNTWTFWKAGDAINSTTTTESFPPVTLAVGSDLTADMYGLCTGDFNRSFDPSLTKAASSTLQLIYAGNRQAGANQEFDLPIKTVNSIGVGAVSLILNFPAEMVEVKDVFMNNAGGRLDWAVKGNELRIGWNSIVPVYLGSASELVTLKLKTTEAFTVGNSIRLTIASNPLNELADDLYNVIGDAVLSVDAINATVTGVGENPAEDGNSAESGLVLRNYPNPFSNYTTVSYTLPFDGKVSLQVNSILGNLVTNLVSETQAKGEYEVKFNTYGLPSGVYTATLRLKSADNELIRNIKLIYNK